jgi:hypothetical protein
MSTPDWGRFVTRIDVKASIPDLYKSWATRRGIERWFLRLSEFKTRDGDILPADELITAGNTYKWLWYGYPDSSVEHGEILEANGKDYLKFSFGKAGICSVRIKTQEDENIVELMQEAIPTDEQGKYDYHVGCKSGWTFYLANLKSILEGGVDMRNKKEGLKEMLNS